MGDFQDVEIIEVHIQAGDRIESENPLITLESDKATMDVPAQAVSYSHLRAHETREDVGCRRRLE